MQANSTAARMHRGCLPTRNGRSRARPARIGPTPPHGGRRASSGRKQIDASIARAADAEHLYGGPYVDNSRVRVAGPFTVPPVPADHVDRVVSTGSPTSCTALGMHGTNAEHGQVASVALAQLYCCDGCVLRQVQAAEGVSFDLHQLAIGEERRRSARFPGSGGLGDVPRRRSSSQAVAGNCGKGCMAEPHVLTWLISMEGKGASHALVRERPDWFPPRRR
jgi:hypothetical protein